MQVKRRIFVDFHLLFPTFLCGFFLFQQVKAVFLIGGDGMCYISRGSQWKQISLPTFFCLFFNFIWISQMLFFHTSHLVYVPYFSQMRKTELIEMQMSIKLHHFFSRDSTKAQLHTVNTFYFHQTSPWWPFFKLGLWGLNKKGAKLIWNLWQHRPDLS